MPFEECEWGSPGLPEDLDPVQDCRRPRRNASFFNGLIFQPAQTGEDRISPASPYATGRGYGSNLDTPWSALVLAGNGEGGQASHVVLPVCP